MIVIPMAGLSARFTAAGYTLPKYMLEAHGQTLFEWSVRSFANSFAEEPFLFIVRDVAGTPNFVRAKAAELGIERTMVAVVPGPTDGQAHTVALGLAAAESEPHFAADEPLTIFNIDTIRHNLAWPAQRSAWDGYLEVFKGSGANWSYVLPSGNGQLVAKTAEKQPISDLCCTGLYAFKSVGHFREAYDEGDRRREAVHGGLKEKYVAPLYNGSIHLGRRIGYDLIAADDVTFVGTPAEYTDFLGASPVPSCRAA